MVKVTKQKVDLWLSQGGVLGEEQISILEKFTEEHPYYGPTQAILAKAYFNTRNQNFEKQLKKAALCINDRLWLYNFIHQTKVEEKIVAATEPKVKVVAKVEETVKLEVKKTTLEKKVEPVKATKKKATSKKGVEINKTAPKTRKIQKKTADKTSVKINIAQGEGDVVTNLNEDQEELTAKIPKLQLEEPRVQNLEEPKEDKQEAFKIAASKSSGHTFLDWLDYTGLNQESKINELKVEVIPKKPRGKENNVGKTVDLLEKFIANKPKPGEIKLDSYKPEEKSLASDSEDLIPVSETLAEVLISQNELGKAVEVYQKLMLKFPQKSAYFAALIQKLNNK